MLKGKILMNNKYLITTKLIPYFRLNFRIPNTKFYKMKNPHNQVTITIQFLVYPQILYLMIEPKRHQLINKKFYISFKILSNKTNKIFKNKIINKINLSIIIKIFKLINISLKIRIMTI